MITIKKILVPTDFSNFSVAAIGYASSLAKSHGAEVLVLHAVPVAAMKERFAPGYVTEGLIEPAGASMAGGQPNVEGLFEAKKQLVVNFLGQKIAPETLNSVKIRPVIRLGKVVEEIVAAAKEEQCDLIVITSHASRLRRLFHGSFTDRVIRGAPCPVLSIQPSAEIRTDKDERLAVRLIDRWAA
jgi:nucleotide-binding universal stress UspA family protein